MKVIYYFLLILSIVLLTRCSTDKIEKFDERNYISFDVNEVEEGYPKLSYTFTFSEESVREVIYEVPVVYAGRYNNKVVFLASCGGGKYCCVKYSLSIIRWRCVVY